MSKKHNDPVFEKYHFDYYEKPFYINESLELTIGTEGHISAGGTQSFYKIPSGRNIKVKSEVHPMYTGGGEEALIDSVFETTNWRAGQWQSYFGKDFEAVVEFDQPKELSFAGIHVLEEPGPWIFYPSEVRFLGSNDGVNFSDLGIVKGSLPKGLKPPETKVMGTEVRGRYKFLKVIALTGGRLPSWHESAGQPTHLFIDEIIVK